MPGIFEFRCDHCGFELPTGWGGYMYVVNDQGERIVCPHPCEDLTVREVLGPNASRQLTRQRTGFNSYCVCLDCLHQCELDLGNEGCLFFFFVRQPRDLWSCPHCRSRKIRTVDELTGEPCPECQVGTIVAIYTGIVT